jgi:hypothetical protein
VKRTSDLLVDYDGTAGNVPAKVVINVTVSARA